MEGSRGRSSREGGGAIERDVGSLEGVRGHLEGVGGLGCSRQARGELNQKKSGY